MPGSPRPYAPAAAGCPSPGRTRRNSSTAPAYGAAPARRRKNPGSTGRTAGRETPAAPPETLPGLPSPAAAGTGPPPVHGLP